MMSANDDDHMKRCVECFTKIPDQANKCTSCGSYQNWKRHLWFSQSSLALVISAIALAGHFTTGGFFIKEQIGEIFPASNFNVDMSVIDITASKLDAVINNNTNMNLSLKSVSCILYLQKNSDGYWHRMLSEGTEQGFPEISQEQSIGPFVVEFELNKPILLKERESMIISPENVLWGGPISGDAGNRVSLCAIGVLPNMDKHALGAAIISDLQLTEIDPIEVFSLSTFKPGSDFDREGIVADVKKTREISSDN